MKISQKLILSYVLIGIMVGAVALISINFTKETLIEFEGEETINYANEIGDSLIIDIEYRISESKELAKNIEIMDEVKKSNSIFDSFSEPESIIETRDSLWRNEFSKDIDFINESFNNPISETLNKKINFYADEYNSVVFAEIFVTNSYGVNVGQTGKTSDYLQSDEQWWELAKKKGMHVSPLNYDKSSEVYSIDISHKITDDKGNFVGVMKAVLNSEEFLNIVTKSKEHHSSTIEIYLIDDEHKILYTTSENPISEALLKDFRNTEFGITDNDSRFISISDKLKIDAISELGLSVVIEHDPEEIFSKIDSFVLIISTFSAIVTIGAVTFGLAISRSIVLPLRTLSKSSDKLSSGVLEEPIVINSNNEFGELGKKFEHMRIELKSKNDSLKKELKQRTRRLADYKTAIDKHSLVSITDKNGNITYVNERFCDVSKYNAEELIGKNHRILKSDHHSKEFFEGIWTVITKGGVWKGDIKNKAKDGSHYWVKSIIAPLFDDFGNIDEYIAIRTDITAQKKTEEALSKALDENKKVEKLKEEFMTMISHELKTPLTPIALWAGALKDENIMGKLNEEQLEAVNTISNAAEELTGLVTDMFDSYKLDLNQITFSFKEFSVDDIMNESYELAKKTSEEKGVSIENTSQKIGMMWGDPKRIMQIMRNMIYNAIDFVDQDNGRIVINASTNEEQVIFSVKDNGIGISKEDQENLFKKFYQADTSTTREHGGSGLGLAICQGLVAGMKGKIWVESEIGKGTTFYFSLPKEKPENHVEFQKLEENIQISN